ncbi:MAG TPA: hypothetical protein VFW07_16065 [Parafilimonas sp.]|nr:hypothetical protein [Parafilimonas sp.]
MSSKVTNTRKIIPLMCICMLLLCAQCLRAQDSTGSGEAKLDISFGEQDSIRQVTAKLTHADTAVTGIDIHFYAKKSFGLLPLEGDNITTDDNGEATVDFPADLPGDASGNVVVIAKVEDDENLGTVEVSKTINWGVPAKPEHMQTRALWTSGNNAPWPLAITVTSIVVVVWGIIFYMFYQLVRIKRAGKYSEI